MGKIKMWGFIFVFMSILLSITNLFYMKITGAIIGTEIKTSFLTILTLGFLIVGLLFLSNLEKKISNWIKAAAIAGSVAVVGIPAYNSTNTNNNNLDNNQKNKTEVKRSVPESVAMDKVDITNHWSDTLGRFQRTYRWDRILDEAEEKYGVPKGTLKGVVMKESYGDPVRTSGTLDGGVGLLMFQPGTAQDMGLKTYGDSKAWKADTKHGKELKKLVKESNYDYGKLAEIDERFDVRKSAEAAAKYLKRNYNKYGSWDKALLAYNQGGKYLKNASETKYVKDVNAYTKYYNERDEKGKKYYRKLDRIKKRENRINNRRR